MLRSILKLCEDPLRLLREIASGIPSARKTYEVFFLCVDNAEM